MARSKKRRGRRSSAEEGWWTWWDQLSNRTQHLICLLFLLGLSVAFFASIHFTGQSLVGGDTVNWRAMAEAMMEYRAETGQEPLWDPNAFGGMPGYMISYHEQIPQLDDVLSWLRQFAWPSSHFVFLLFGTYFLVVFLTRDKLSSVLAASAYGLTTYLPILLTAGHNTKFIALCYAPWLALAFAYVLRQPKLLSSLLFAVALALNLRAGHVQITYYITFLLGVWWIVEGIGAIRNGQFRDFGRATGWLALGSVLGLLMVAQPYLVNAEYKAYTIRGSATGGGSGGLDLDYALRWSQGPAELITFAIADAFGGGPPTYWGPKPFTEGPHYLGGLVLLLAGIGLWRYRKKVTWAFGIGALLMTLFALGRHLPALNEPMFRYFPLFDAFRAPETWLSMVAFALAVLAGFGLYAVVRPEANKQARHETTRTVYIASGTALGLVLILLFAGNAIFDFEPSPARQQATRQQAAQQVARQNDVSPDDPRVQQAVDRYLSQQKSERADMFRDGAERTLLFLVLGAVLLVAYRRGTFPAWAMQAGLVLLVVVDLWGVDRRYFNQEDLSQASSITSKIATYGFDRYILKQQKAAGGAGHFRVLSLEGDPMTTARPSYYYESLGGYHGAKLQLYQDYIDHIFRDPQTGRISETALDLLNTRYIIASRKMPGTRIVYRDEQTGWLVLENVDVPPRVFFVGQTEVVRDREETWQRLRSPSFDPQQTALLPGPIDVETTPIDSSSTTRVTLQKYTPREIVWAAQTDAPRLLVASEVYYPEGWKAYVDGERVPIHRVDYLLRGVAVSEGEHEVVMRFDPRSHTLGVWISGLSTVLVYGGVLAILGMGYVRRRSGGEEETADKGTSDE